MSTVTGCGNELSLKISQCRIVDNKAYRTLPILYANRKLKLNFYHQAADSVGLHGITWKK